MRIDHINRSQKSIDLFIGQVVANHKLVVDGKVIPLKKLSPPGTSVRLSVGRENSCSLILGGVCSVAEHSLSQNEKDLSKEELQQLMKHIRSWVETMGWIIIITLEL